MSPTPEQRKSNLRLALFRACVAAIFGIGFVVKIAFLGAS